MGKGLDLSTKYPEVIDEITGPDGKVFEITTNIPNEIMEDLLDVSSDADHYSGDDERKLKACLIKIMSVKNDEADVEVFFKSLNLPEYNKVKIFLMEFINQVNTNAKKKG